MHTLRCELFLIIYFICVFQLTGCANTPVNYSRSIVKEKNQIVDPPPLPPRKPNAVGNRRAYFGIHANTCLNYKGERGAYIVGFYKESPAREKGLGVGDRVIEFGGKKIFSSGDLTVAIKLFPPDDAASISIVRPNGTTIPNIYVIGRGYEYSPRLDDPIDKPDSISLCKNIGLLPA